MTLFSRTIGAGPRLVLVHGFTQNSRCWGRFADRLSEHFEVVMVDVPGHGRSAHDDADLEAAGRLITEIGGAAHYLGYSMGARMLLHAALGQSDRVMSSTLIGATAGIREADERGERRAADDLLADRLVPLGLSAFLDSWLDQPLFATLPHSAAARSERLENRPEGLAASLRHCGTGRQSPLWDRLPTLAMPVHIVVGTLDQKFAALGRQMADQIPSSELTSIGGGHAIHAEQPDAVADAVTGFLHGVAP